MSLDSDLKSQVSEIFALNWTVRNGQSVPDAVNLRLGNDAVKLDATVLYADMARSTALVDNSESYFAAEVYKTFLICAARIIKFRSGNITAYDGDRIMAVFIGDSKNTNAVRAALNINYAMLKIIRPALAKAYPNQDYIPSHAVGVDTSKLFVARVGVRNDNDLVWVGRAANHAAKLCDLRDGEYRSWISAEVYDLMYDNLKYNEDDGRSMWEARRWTAMNNRSIYRSNWRSNVGLI